MDRPMDGWTDKWINRWIIHLILVDYKSKYRYDMVHFI